MITGYTDLASYKVISFDKIPSTQTYALNLVGVGRATDHTAIVAEAQSAGRGRYRRTWVSHHGNLYVSFIFDCDERDPRLSYVVAVAIVETMLAYGVRATIKWPNDILVDGKKICGVLIEYAGPFVIVGIGVNIKTNPTVEKYETTKLDNYTTVQKSDFLGCLMKNLDTWRNADFLDVRARWTEFAMALNKSVKYRGEQYELIGINEDGVLMLRHDDRYTLVYGDEISM